MEVIDDLKQLMKDHKISLLSISNILIAYYIETDKKPENYYQRLTSLVKGEYKEITPEEEQGIRRLIHVERNKHAYGKALNALGNVDRKLKALESALNTGLQNPINTKRILQAFKQLSSLSL
jgi:hypothetical protein